VRGETERQKRPSGGKAAGKNQKDGRVRKDSSKGGQEVRKRSGGQTGSRSRVLEDGKEKEKIVDFTPEQNKQKITFCIKGQVFVLSVAEVFVLNHVMIEVLKNNQNFVGLFTDFNKYNVGWCYGPLTTNIEQLCVK